MKIANNTVVSIHYRLTNDANVELDASPADEPLVYLHGGGELIDGLERALEGKQRGESFAVSIDPADAYGDEDPGLVRNLHIDEFNGIEMREGMQLQAKDPEGNFRLIRVVRIENEQVTIDMNHPLAGQTLNFEISIADVRAATEEELDHGHAHHPGHHHH